jgi:hypothetical protein
MNRELLSNPKVTDAHVASSRPSPPLQDFDDLPDHIPEIPSMSFTLSSTPASPETAATIAIVNSITAPLPEP